MSELAWEQVQAAASRRETGGGLRGVDFILNEDFGSEFGRCAKKHPRTQCDYETTDSGISSLRSM